MPEEVLRWDLTKEGAAFEAAKVRLPHKRRSFAGAALGSKYFLVGGLGDTMKPVAPVDVFDFETGAWSSIASPSHPPVFADLVSLDGKLYMAGGFVTSTAGHFEPVLDRGIRPGIEPLDDFVGIVARAAGACPDAGGARASSAGRNGSRGLGLVPACPGGAVSDRTGPC